MAWIESHQSLSRHRKTLRAVSLLRTDRHKFLGHLHELWWWALDNVPSDGCLHDLTDEDLSAAAQWEGDPAEFRRCLVEAGFVDVDDGGERWLHDWYEYAGKLLCRRAEKARRMRVSRQRGGNVDTTLPPHGGHVAAMCPRPFDASADGDKPESLSYVTVAYNSATADDLHPAIEPESGLIGDCAPHVDATCQPRASHVVPLPYPTVPPPGGTSDKPKHPVITRVPPSMDPDVVAIHAHFQGRIKPGARLTDKAAAKIRARLAGGFSVDELKRGIDNFAADFWYMDHCASEPLAWFFASDDRSEKFRDMAPRARPPTEQPAHETDRRPHIPLSEVV